MEVYNQIELSTFEKPLGFGSITSYWLGVQSLEFGKHICAL